MFVVVVVVYAIEVILSLLFLNEVGGSALPRVQGLLWVVLCAFP